MHETERDIKDYDGYGASPDGPSQIREATSIEVVQMAIIGLGVGFVLLVMYALSDDTEAPVDAIFNY